MAFGEEIRRGVEKVLSEMKNAGMNAAFLREDGILIHSTFALDEAGAATIVNTINVSDAIMRLLHDSQKEVEVVVDGFHVVAIPMKTFILCGVLKGREEKPKLRQYADKIKALL